MAAKIIDGKAIASSIRESLKKEAAELSARAGRPPCLSVILVGDDPASAIYVRMKGKACAETGFESRTFTMPAETTEDALLEKIDELNADESVDGILVQLPLPDHINESAVLERIRPDKDVDGFHPVNVGKLVIGEKTLIPCTPHGIIKMLEHEGVEVKGKRAVVIGRSNIVGKPVATLLLHRHATVTICHSRTQDLPAVSREADILIAAVGRPEMVTAEFVKEGAVVIDVGVNRLPDGKLVGDVKFDEVSRVASKITPVPGGVGPMTITMLLYNTLQAFRDHVNA
ncbi:MAG: bifunctional methylenetetrahydrofolate dehydrogenase/methenyltetrahydrofolate cyclohydrolase FolD [Deltaproteobacteria bacterium]|nr:MAG: bifunctional methylenetetrahydrofolate dehydrogenase/methenyltetrahydrofolate cyclohydrolase FolD [Deltaproteobacteria bacterium]